MSSFVIKSVGNALNATSLVSSRYASQKALTLFASPRKGRYNEKQKTVVSDAEQVDLSYDGLKIATYHWQGSGPTVLLAHGWESNASRWQYILEDLKKKDFNIVALDAPVHGQSGGKLFSAIFYAEFLAEVIKHYNPMTLIGHSVGGMASVFCQYNNNFENIKKLVLLGAPAHFTGVFSRYKQMMGYNRRISNGLDNLVLQRFGKPVDYFSAANFTQSITADGLIIHDKHDKIIPYEDALEFNSKYNNAELITTTGFGHGLRDTSLTPRIIDFINL
ncbi:alpha/beta fold hydrolase [Winogradskyella aurantiaca]|uniref:alpha/beta fold hydrolase n=1 Tax=Winogradskyella aurantiaca TaxID=2219558 RepID=UPI000E1DD6E3|nr:alpha/beta hydrolase [Winogradskyella aurantiaca]